EDFDLRGVASMRVLREKLDPMPEVPPGAPAGNLIQLGAAAKYRAGIDYRVVVEMIPDYIVANKQQSKFCIYEAKFPASAKGHDAWMMVKSNPLPILYRVTLPGLNYAGETELFHPQRTFYESFLKAGAFDCGPTPNVDF